MATTQTVYTGTVRPPQATVRRGFLPGLPVKISWSGIFGGAVAAVSVWILLYALGLALGLSGINPDSSSVKASSIFTGVWSIIVPLVALFIGGFVAARGGGAANRQDGAMDGLIVWGVTTLLGLFVVGNLLGAIVSGAGAIGKTALEAIGVAAPAAADMSKTFSLDADDALKPVNQKLRAAGKPEVTADQLKSTAKDAINDGLKTGRINRESLVGALSTNTQLSRDDAEELASRIDTQFNDAKQKLATSAAKAAGTTGKVFWGVFGALLLGLVASILGGLVGVPRREVVVTTG
jgi:hypothetical protein